MLFRSPRDAAAEGADHHIDQERKCAEAHQQGTDAADLVEGGEGGVVFSDAPWHTVQTQPVLGGEAEIEANECEQKVKAAKIFVQHSAGKFGIPMINGTKNNKHGSSINNVMEVADNKVGVMDMNIKRNLGQGNAGDASEHEIHNESTSEIGRAHV